MTPAVLDTNPPTNAFAPASVAPNTLPERQGSPQRGPFAAVSSSLARWIFNRVHGNCLVYNTCWEDPRLDREVLRLSADDDVVMITSAGCNALDYALDGPRSIHAVDMNFRQNALLELKLAGIRQLDFERFFEIFGYGGHREFPAWYRLHLRSELTPIAREYWDQRTHYFSRANAEDSFYHRGTTGHFGRLLTGYFKVAGFYPDAQRLFHVGTLAEQRDIYERAIKPRFFRGSLKRLLETDLSLSLLGIPKAQRDHLEKTCGMGMADFMEDCVEAVFTRLPAAENYFWHLYLFGRYSRECCPNYLRPVEFARLKGGLADRIHIHTADVASFLRGHTDSVSRFVLLDHMDWLSHEHPALLAAEWQAIMDRARSGARLLWRSGGFKVDFVDPLTVNYKGQARRLGDLLRYDIPSAANCHARDRVHTYGSFYIADFIG
jgi:S-adenosylmethionine-diacylglycerol 3-amino-3-carboxypropyl transferase